MNKLIDFFARQKTFPELVTILVIAGGLFALSDIRREAFPNVEFDMVMVTTIYSGASPKEVERLIAAPMEEEIKEVVGIKKLTSISVEGRSEIVIQVDPDQATTDEVKDDVQLALDRASSLPDEAEDPIVTVIESKIMPVIEVALSADIDDVALKGVAKFVEREVEDIPEVSGVDLMGEKKYEYRIQIDINKLQRTDISLQEVLSALSETNVTVPAGDFVIHEEGSLKKDMVVRTTGEFKDAEDIKNLVIRTNDWGRAIKISDIATVDFQLAEPNILYRAVGKSTVRLVVKKKEMEDAITLVDNLHAKMEELKSHPKMEGVNVDYINDSSYYIKNRLGILTSNLIVGLILVLCILSLFLPVRVALIASIGIPFSFLAAIWVFNYMGFSLNMISVMGLIIVIGMVVDDAIVVIENSVRYIEEGLEPLEATIQATQNIWKAVFASVMTTVLAFWPMTMITGIFGKFVMYIPYAVILALVASMIEAYFVLPSHVARWVKPIDKSKAPRFKQKFEQGWTALVNFYGKFLAFIIKKPWRYVSLGVFILFFALSFVIGFKSLRFILFPPEGVEIFIVKMEAPRGSTLQQTQDLILPIEKAILEIPDEELMNYIISVGEQNEGDPSQTKRGSQYAMAMVYLTPENKRERLAGDIIDEVREKIGQPDKLKVTTKRVNPGPPVGSPINVGVRGESFKDIESALKDLEAELSKWDEVKNLDSNYKYSKDERVLTYKALDATQAGLTVKTIGMNVMALFEGVIPTTMRGAEEEIDVRVTFQEDQQSLDLLNKLKILSPSGVLVPLNKVVNVSESRGLEAVYREDGRRQFSLSGDIDTDKTTALEITAKIKTWIDGSLQKKYPELSFHYGGENEDTTESLGSLKRTFLLSVCLIFFILVMTFGNFYQPFLILSAVPLGMVAVLWALILHGQPLSFMAILGVVALAGVIVNNAIVFVDFYNDGRAKGMSLEEAIVRSGRLRLRAVTLTAATTVFGLLPTAYGIGGLDKFVVPIALALGWGMLIGSIMVMLFIPVLLAVIERK